LKYPEILKDFNSGTFIDSTGKKLSGAVLRSYVFGDFFFFLIMLPI